MQALTSGTVVNGRYRVEKLIGRGGMGTVYAVRHTNTDEKLALKLLHPSLTENAQAVERFRTEARAPVKIGSEHVLRVFDADVSDDLGGVPFIVMERLRGRDLRTELQKRGALPAGEVVLYLRQVARALDKAHKFNIVHRDLKPANLYITKREDGEPLIKILDFGIAKLTDRTSGELTVAGEVFGTPWYMAPEQAKGELKEVGPPTDIWALGLITYQLLTGRNYWTADNMASLVGQICYEPMPAPSESAPHLTAQFDAWFAKACHRNPTERFQSAGDMVMQLSQILGVATAGAAGLSTSGSGRNPFESSGPSFSQAAGQSAPRAALGDSSLPAGIPGTVLSGGRALDSTGAPLYATQMPPVRRKSSSAMAVAIGVVGALILGAGGAGVYFATRPVAGATAGPETTEVGNAAAATKTEAAPAIAEPPATVAEPPDAPDSASVAADSASAEPPAASVEATTNPPVSTVSPPVTTTTSAVPPPTKTTATSAWSPPPKTTSTATATKPPPTATTAPKVGNIVF